MIWALFFMGQLTAFVAVVAMTTPDRWPSDEPWPQDWGTLPRASEKK
jgi:hypothetical protein